jgi:hypothetical protein
MGSRFRKAVVGFTLAGAVLTGGGIAYAATTSPTTTPSASTTAPSSGSTTAPSSGSTAPAAGTHPNCPNM